MSNDLKLYLTRDLEKHLVARPIERNAFELHHRISVPILDISGHFRRTGPVRQRRGPSEQKEPTRRAGEQESARARVLRQLVLKFVHVQTSNYFRGSGGSTSLSLRRGGAGRSTDGRAISRVTV